MSTAQSYTRILYETPAPHVARIVLNRVDKRNAQDTQLLYELNQAFDRAAQADDVKVIVLAANGPHFSAGHDLRDVDQFDTAERFKTVSNESGFRKPGMEGRYAFEREVFFGLCERWRNIPKPTIAQVHGKVIAAGLMLAWPCDLIVAADDTQFQDNTVVMGAPGVEFFAHPWELGVRRAKELLFRADWLSADQALRLGMVNHVVPRAQLEQFTLDIAIDIAKKPLFALKLAKEAVNAAQDAQGRTQAMQRAFALHELAHAHNLLTSGMLVDESYFATAPMLKDAVAGLRELQSSSPKPSPSG